MHLNKAILLSMASALTLVMTGATLAGGKGDHHHKNDMKHHNTDHQQASHHDDHGDAHRHDRWETPPAAYSEHVYEKWDDLSAAQRGKYLYQQNCASCHGDSGKGDGPAGTALTHPPADLTNHFHSAPGQGDSYLFWRISEGGMVEPFRSQNSAMPPFKSMLSEQQRWDVLAYIHQQFHGGFKQPAGQHEQQKNSSHGH